MGKCENEQIKEKALPIREGLLNKIGTPAVLLFNPSRVHRRSPGKKIFILESYFSHSGL